MPSTLPQSQSSTPPSPPSHQPTTPSRPQVNVGVGVALFLFSPSRPSKFLVGKRLGSHGSGTWALPGGHLDYGETFEECAARELLEETGLRVDLNEKGMRFLTATNDVFPASGTLEKGGGEGRRGGGGEKHYVTIFMVGTVGEGDEREGREARVMEPEKCEGWEWVGWEEVVGLARAKEEVEMQERMTERFGGEEKGKREEGQETKGEEVKAKEVRRLFLPLRNLIKQRPDVLPRFD